MTTIVTSQNIENNNRHIIIEMLVRTKLGYLFLRTDLSDFGVIVKKKLSECWSPIFARRSAERRATYVDRS